MDDRKKGAEKMEKCIFGQATEATDQAEAYRSLHNN